MKIDKQIKGEKVRFYVNFKVNTMTAEVKYFHSDNPVVGKITEDFKHIILPEDFLSPYISGYGRVKVGKLKLDKFLSRDAKDYNENFLKNNL